jgi:hypothetical protein
MVPPIPGDFNLDGVVDNLDKAIWFANVFTGKTWAQGDANGDGVVNGLDLDILNANFGRSIFSKYRAPSPCPTPQPAPTPAPLIPAGPIVATLIPASPLKPAISANQLSLAASAQAGASLLSMAAMAATSASPSSALAVGIQASPGVQNQQPSVSASQAKTASTSARTSGSVASMPIAAVSLAAHDAVFSQIENGTCAVTDGVLVSGKVDSATSLLATALDLKKLVV